MVIIAYLVFTTSVVWILARRVPSAMTRTLIAVGVLVSGLPTILAVLAKVLA
ncbi:hypothetical protein [Saccharothrix sp. Mg75]|uniref:hypothetical protein n=1 Tax=Saccharothrix sp. Mg75 TaxID=3445357 RepID=UPI003EEC179D